MQIKGTSNDKPDDLSKFSVASGQITEKKYEIKEQSEAAQEPEEKSLESQALDQIHEQKQTIQKQNIFAKSRDLSKKKVQPKKGDIFTDLQQKRPNPFATNNDKGNAKKKKVL